MSDKEEQAVVPYFAHEGALARMERIHKFTILALVFALVVCLIAFVINDTSWRRHYDTLDSRYYQLVEEVHNGVYEHTDTQSD